LVEGTACMPHLENISTSFHPHFPLPDTATESTDTQITRVVLPRLEARLRRFQQLSGEPIDPN
jgi:hypothetical protein